jgi:uncharacterized membrane protein
VDNRARSLCIGLLAVASSLLIHWAVLRRDLLLEWLALTALAATPLFNGLISWRPAAWLSLMVIAGGLGLLTQLGGAALALHLPSILIPALLACVFGGTLREGREPLITQIARAARGEMPSDLHAYTRTLTQMWTGTFVLMAAVSAALSFFASREVWSWVANFGSYLFVGSLIVAEYLYRRMRFASYSHPGFVEYLRILFTANVRRL